MSDANLAAVLAFMFIVHCFHSYATIKLVFSHRAMWDRQKGELSDQGKAAGIRIDGQGKAEGDIQQGR